MIFLKKVKDVFMKNLFENLTNSTKKRNWSIVRQFRRIVFFKDPVITPAPNHETVQSLKLLSVQYLQIWVRVLVPMALYNYYNITVASVNLNLE